MNTNHTEAPSATAACAMVIFGATGDLTKRKLLPALLNLAQENVLPQHFAIIGVAGGGATTESFRKSLIAEIPQFAPDPIDLKMWDWLVDQRLADRKSTRLNSSHLGISYAVFCLKKKKNSQAHDSQAA